MCSFFHGHTGVSKIEPISGVAGMRPAVDITLLNRKEGLESWNCKYIPIGPGWNKSNPLPPIRAAGFNMQTKRLTCGIPDDILRLEDGAPWAQVRSPLFCGHGRAARRGGAWWWSSLARSCRAPTEWTIHLRIAQGFIIKTVASEQGRFLQYFITHLFYYTTLRYPKVNSLLIWACGSCALHRCAPLVRVALQCTFLSLTFGPFAAVGRGC